MKTRALKIFCVFALVALAAVPAMAAQVTGLIVDTKDVKIKNQDMQNKVLLLRTQDDRIIVADLGPTRALQNINLKKDQQIQLEGDRVRVGNRPVFLVTRATVEGRDIQVQRANQQQKGAADRTKAGGIKNVKGEVINEKNVDIKGQDQTHRVVMLKTQKGHQVVADLGPQDKLQDLQIQKGKQLEVQGRIARVSDHLLVVANKVQADGKTVNIQRKRSRTAGPGHSPVTKPSQSGMNPG